MEIKINFDDAEDLKYKSIDMVKSLLKTDCVNHRVEHGRAAYIYDHSKGKLWWVYTSDHSSWGQALAASYPNLDITYVYKDYTVTKVYGTVSDYK